MGSPSTLFPLEFFRGEPKLLLEEKNASPNLRLASRLNLATIALPSFLLKHPDNTSEESTTVKGVPRSDDLKMEKEAGSFTTYQDLLVKEPVHPVEGADPEFWRANGRQWVADQARNLLIIVSLFFFQSVKVQIQLS